MSDQNFDNLPQQEAYGNLLQILVNISLVMIITSFLVYLGGFLDPLIPITDLPSKWSLPLNEFIAATGSPTGWSWTALVSKGDYLNLVGIAFMGAASGVCYLVMLVSFIKAKNNIATVVAIIELFLIALAASNIMSVGGH